MPDVLLIEQLVGNALERAWPAATHRRIRLPALPGKADAVIGPRHAGKTWLLYAHAAALQAGPEAVPREQILYLNFEDERLAGLGTDVDFLATDGDEKPLLVQVSADIRDPATRAREVGALATAMLERNIRDGIILTLDGAETLTVPEGHIHVRAAWEWLASGG